MPPPAILSLSGLQRFGKQAASLFLLCSGPVFISFIQRVPGKVLKLATGIICFSSCLPQADAARLPVLPCSPDAPALQRIPCTRVCVCVQGRQTASGFLRSPAASQLCLCGCLPPSAELRAGGSEPRAAAPPSGCGEGRAVLVALGQHGAVALGKMQMVLKELGAAPPDTSPCSDAVCPIAECPTRWKKPPAFGDRSTLVSVQAFAAGCPIAGREPEAQKGMEKPVCVSYRQQSANVGSPHPPEASTRCWSRGGHSSAGL